MGFARRRRNSAGTPSVVKIVMNVDGTPIDELSRSWDTIRKNYQTSRNSEYDRTVRECATRLAADPGGEAAYMWTFGLVVMAPYVTWLPARASSGTPWRPWRLPTAR